MKITKPVLCGIVLTLFAAIDVHAQNVGIGVSSPQSKLTVNGSFAVGAGYNLAAPTNGALIQGYLGIGTTAPLAVETNNLLNQTNGVRTFFDSATIPQLTQQTVTTFQNVASAVFVETVFTKDAFISYSGSLTASDTRLKDIIGRSDSASDLETLKKIEITDYTMKDGVTYGNHPVKKVVAQQLEQFYPTAVRSIGLKGVTFTPDIYALSDSIKLEKPDVYTITLAKTHGLKDGDTVRLITQQNNHDLKMVAHVVNDMTFSVETKEPLGDRVFVYGKQCMDLKGVDYDAISMLNVSATQELAKEVEALQQENKRLANEEASERAEIANLKSSNDKLTAMAAKMEELEKKVATMQAKENGRVRTAALSQ